MDKMMLKEKPVFEGERRTKSDLMLVRAKTLYISSQIE